MKNESEMLRDLILDNEDRPSKYGITSQIPILLPILLGFIYFCGYRYYLTFSWMLNISVRTLDINIYTILIDGFYIVYPFILIYIFVSFISNSLILKNKSIIIVLSSNIIYIITIKINSTTIITSNFIKENLFSLNISISLSIILLIIIIFINSIGKIKNLILLFTILLSLQTMIKYSEIKGYQSYDKFLLSAKEPSSTSIILNADIGLYNKKILNNNLFEYSNIKIIFNNKDTIYLSQYQINEIKIYSISKSNNNAITIYTIRE